MDLCGGASRSGGRLWIATVAVMVLQQQTGAAAYYVTPTPGQQSTDAKMAHRDVKTPSGREGAGGWNTCSPSAPARTGGPHLAAALSTIQQTGEWRGLWIVNLSSLAGTPQGKLRVDLFRADGPIVC
jgi:hypothetical protein